MSDTVLNVQDTEHFPFFKKHTKASKISRVSVQQNFAHKGWNSCATQFDLTSGESEYDIKSSPTNYYKTSCKRIPIQDEYPKKKPMLVEISNIESLFKEKEIKFLQENSCLNYGDFKKNLCKKDKVLNNSFRKRIKSTPLNFEDIKETFHVKKEHIRESKISDDLCELISDYSPSKISSHEKEKTNKCNKLKNSFEAFINNSFGEKCISKNIDSGNFIKDNFIPVKVKSSKMSNTAHSLVFVKDENETHTTTSSTKLKSENFNSNKLKKSSNSDQIISKSNYEISQRLFVEESETLINNYISDLNLNCINIINDESSPEVKSPNILCTSLSVAEGKCFKNVNETLKCENLKENVDSKNYINCNYNFPNSSNDICNGISISCMEDNKTCISKYSSDYSTESSKICQESSPVQITSPEIDCMPQSVVSIQRFEEDKGASEFNQNFVLDAKSTVFENKTFMKSEMNFKERCSSTNKGSNWVQSLNWSDISLAKDSTSDNCDLTRRKILKNIVQGGFAEQMLKLQRRERSDRVIWNHKVTELKKKASGNSVTLTLVSFICIGQIIVTKCYALEEEEERIKEILCTMEVDDSHQSSLLSMFDKLKDASCDNTLQNLGLKPFMVLFKKAIFSKLCLKSKDMFVLYPPWQMLCGKSLPVPVILCTYYVDNLYKSMDIPTTPHPVHSQLVTYYSLQSEEVECKKLKLSNTSLDSLDLYGRCVCIGARVQRIWKNFIQNDKIQDMLKIDFLGYSLLLQNEDGVFLELKINSIDLSPSYQQFLSDAEGHCFKFCDVVMSHRFNINKCHELSRIMEFILKETKTNVALSSSPLYCYQFIPSSFSKLPCKISDENFPEYCDLEIKSLSFVLKNNLNGTRVSCIGKVLFQNGNDFCICDESLLSSKLQKYCMLKFANIKQVHKLAIVGASILIKEAMIKEDFLLVDKFSSCEIISSIEFNKLNLSCEPRLKKIGLITNELILSPLSLSSKVKELVLVKGLITEVDENSAISWLECSQCLKENLLEDSNSVIYCEDCSCIVSNPVLKVKMEVTVHSEDLSIAKVKIQLQSSTIKRILNIKEDNYSPQCNISDVFKKSTGVLSCYVRAIDIVNKQKVFYLTEMICS